MEILGDKLIVVNLFAEPGAGKSTVAAGVFEELKWLGVEVELVREYAKDCVWEGRNKMFTPLNQAKLFGDQLYRQTTLINEVNVVVTDSPLPLSLIYNQAYPHDSFTEVILNAFTAFDNINYLLDRTKPYNPHGRNQTEDESKAIALEIVSLLKRNRIPHTRLPANRETKHIIVKDVLARLKR